MLCKIIHRYTDLNERSEDSGFPKNAEPSKCGFSASNLSRSSIHVSLTAIASVSVPPGWMGMVRSPMWSHASNTYVYEWRRVSRCSVGNKAEGATEQRSNAVAFEMKSFCKARWPCLMIMDFLVLRDIHVLHALLPKHAFKRSSLQHHRHCTNFKLSIVLGIWTH